MTGRTPKLMRLASFRVAALIVVFALTGACMSTNQHDGEQPPDREFDQSTAWDRIEEAAAESIDGLPDFPGFKVRILQKLECTHNGQADEEYVNLELSYQFSEEISNDPLVRETYLAHFREQWQEAGYDIHRDTQVGDDPPHYALEARRSDGVNYWYRVGRLAVLKIQSGCVKVVEGWPSACPDPLGGVTPENDRAAKRYCETGEEAETSEEADAIAPFGGATAADAPGAAPWARGPEGPESPMSGPYADQL